MFQKIWPWRLGIILLFLTPQVLVSQISDSLCQWQMRGRVLDSAFHALEGAEVFLKEGKQRVFTDEAGRFLFRNLCRGLYHLHVSHQGEAHADLEIRLNSDTSLTILLGHEEAELGTVHVHRMRSSGQVSAADLQAAAYRQGAAALEALEGVRLLQHGNSISKPMVQGMWGMRVPVFVNGAALEGQAWGMEHGPELDVLGFQFAEVLQGIRALTLGHDAIGGVLNLRTQWNIHAGETDLISQSLYHHNGRGFSQRLALSRRPEGKQHMYRVQAGWKRAGNLQAPDYFLWNTGSSQYSASAELRLLRKSYTHTFGFSAFANRNGIFAGSHVGNLSDLQAAIGREKPITADSFSYGIAKPWQQNEHLTWQWQAHGGSNGNVQWQSSLQYDRRREFDFNRRSTDFRPQLDLRLWAWQLSRTSHFEWKQLRFSHGWQLKAQWQEYRRIFLVPDYRGLQGGVWAALKGSLRAWNWEALLRADAKGLWIDYVRNRQAIHDFRPFAGLAGGLQFSRRHGGWTGIYSLARLWRNPWLNELYSDGVHRGTGAYELGDAGLRQESAFKTEAVWTRRLRQSETRISLYGNRVAHFMNLEPSGEMLLTVRGALPLFVYRQYDAAFAGYSFTWHTQRNDWRFGIRSEASFGRNLESGKPVPLQAPPDVRLILQRRVGNVQFSLEPSHVFRAPFADQLVDFLPPPSAYTLLRASLSWKTQLPGGHDLELLFGGDNLFNAAYRDYLNRFRYYADESGRNLYISLRIALHRHDHDHHIKP